MKSGLMALVFFAFLCDVSGQPPTQDLSRSQISRIAAGFAIVTELSADQVYLGQQLSILYRLEAEKPPLAVDIDPQQFSGFWSEIAPLSEGASAPSRTVSAGRNYRYWLRQVIAYPLVEGSLQLPPLQVKIKTSQSSSHAPDDWDIVKASDSLKISVISPLKNTESNDEFPLVGNVEGKISRVFRGGRTEASLDLWGSANLDLLQVEQWVRSPGNVPLSIRLSDRENTVQTQDIGGRRSISLLQRRRWIIRSPWNTSDEPQIADINLPYFDVRKGSWDTALIEGIGSSAIEASSNPREKSLAPPKIQAPRANGPVLFIYRYSLWIACLFVLIIIVLAIKFLSRRLAP
jgi:hypothetical protein